MTQSSINQSTFHYDSAIDGLRGIAILLVLLSHAGLGYIIPGGLGVTLFFFISGYLITSLLLLEWNRNKTISLSSFYLRRFWRLAPALFLFLLTSLIVTYLYGGYVPLKETLVSLFYFSNYYEIYWNYSYLQIAPSLFKILWSLAVEEHFYLLFAPILLLSKRKGYVFALIVILLLIPLLVRTLVVLYSSSAEFSKEFTSYATEARLDSIVWGSLMAWLIINRGYTAASRLLDNRIALSIAIVTLLTTLLFRDQFFRETIRYSLQGISLLVLTYSSLYGQLSRLARRVLETELLVTIGKLSYSLYLQHRIGMVVAILTTQGQYGIDWHVIYWSISIILALVSYHYIEKPIIGIRQRYGSSAS